MNAGPVIEGSWRRYTYTFVVSTAGRSNADISFNVRFRTSGVSTWDITGIQLEPGPVATPFEHHPIGTELDLCQRYYTRITARRVGANTYYQLPTTMRATPTAGSQFGWDVVSRGTDIYSINTGTAQDGWVDFDAEL
jgi:hypothetical protein